METVIKTEPSVEPISLNELKDHLHIPRANTDEDDYLPSLIKSVRVFVEEKLNRKLITQTWYLYLDNWPIIEEYFELPYGRLQSVISIKYKGTDGSESTWNSNNYIAGIGYEVGRVILGYNKSWPTSVLYPSLPIIVEFKCGYGDVGVDVPDSILSAMKKIMSDMHEEREIRPKANLMDSLAGDLISSYKIWQVY